MFTRGAKKYTKVHIYKYFQTFIMLLSGSILYPFNIVASDFFLLKINFIYKMVHL